MAKLQTGPINTSEYSRSAPEGTPLPAGIYTGTIIKAEQKPTNDNQGIYLNVEINIDSPEEFNTRKFWDSFNVMNASPDAVRIAKECLSDLAAAAGIETLEDDDQLLNQSVMMELYVKEAEEYTDKKTGTKKMGRAQNKCRKYWPLGTDIESAKKAQKDAKKGVAAPGNTQAVTQAAVSKPAGSRFPGSSKAAAPVAQPAAQPAQQAAPAPAAALQAAAPAAGGIAPWKRNKQ